MSTHDERGQRCIMEYMRLMQKWSRQTQDHEHDHAVILQGFNGYDDVDEYETSIKAWKETVDDDRQRMQQRLRLLISMCKPTLNHDDDFTQPGYQKGSAELTPAEPLTGLSDSSFRSMMPESAVNVPVKFAPSWPMMGVNDDQTLNQYPM